MSGAFTFGGAELAYFKHPYNRAGENMRTIEVPIAVNFLQGRPQRHILEIGNVLSHYIKTDWPVLDIKERGQRVINCDVMTWQPAKLFDTIISISTLEHIGHGRYAGFTAAGVTPAQALNRILGWLAPGGQALLTAPLGYNELLDQQLAAGLLPAPGGKAGYMRRISGANEWAECTLAEALASERPAGYRWAVAMVVLFYGQN